MGPGFESQRDHKKPHESGAFLFWRPSAWLELAALAVRRSAGETAFGLGGYSLRSRLVASLGRTKALVCNRSSSDFGTKWRNCIETRCEEPPSEKLSGVQPVVEWFQHIVLKLYRDALWRSTIKEPSGVQLVSLRNRNYNCKIDV